MIKKVKEETFTGTDAEIREKLNSVFVRPLSNKSAPKKRILFLVDNQNWCWTSTARNIAKHIPEYIFQIEPASEFKRHHKAMLEMCDLIYLRGYPFAFFDGLPKIEKPFIWTLSTGGENLKMRIEQSIGYANDALACIVQCNKAKAEAESAGIKNIHVIPNGVDVDHFKPLDAPGKYDIGFAGNNEGDRAFLKGSEFVKEACEFAGKSYIEVTKKNRLSYAEMPSFYNSIKLYAQPSNSEGCSNSVMEALSCGVPCLVCEGVGYHGENCSEKDGVFFVQRSGNDIAASITRIFESPEIYSNARKNARSFALKHSWDIISIKYKSLLDNLFTTIKPKKKETTKQEVKPKTNQEIEREIKEVELSLKREKLKRIKIKNERMIQK